MKNQKKKKHQSLIKKGWRHDGLWWSSPYTGIRYPLSIALDVEELRVWAAKESAYLVDKGHAMWSFQENEDNKILSFEEHRDREAKLQLLRELTGNPHISLPPPA